MVGNCCHDTLLGAGGAEHRVLGGSAAYISAVLRSLGASFRTLSKAGADFRYGGQVAFTPIVEGERTCSFLDDYRGGERRETLQAAGPRIRADDLDRIEGRFRIGIACAIAGEVLPETLHALRGRCDLLLADAQGLVRSFGPGGEVSVQPLARTPFAGALDAIDWLKVGAHELGCIDAESLRANLLLTEGPRGTTLQLGRSGSRDREQRRVPAFPAAERDATGAGDCFLAGFAFGLSRGLDAERAARLGNFCGARAVETVGVPTIDPSQVAELLREDEAT